MNSALKNKILLMDEERLNEIISSPDIYAPETVELAKSRAEEIKRLNEIGAAAKERLGKMSEREIDGILSEPELYNEDIVRAAKLYRKPKQPDFQDVSAKTKEYLSGLSEDELLSMLDDKKKLLPESTVQYIKHLVCGKPGGEEFVPSEPITVPTPQNAAESSETVRERVNVQDGHYLGWKYFLKIQYKTIKTDIIFGDTEMELYQGSGFAKVKNKVRTAIKYDDIRSVEVKRTVSAPSIIFAIISVLMLFVTQMWNSETVLGMAVLVGVDLFLGSNGFARINYGSGETYDIITNFKSECEEIKQKTELAISQYRGGRF